MAMYRKDSVPSEHDDEHEIEEEEAEEKKEFNMDNILALANLMQNNKQMDLPGLLALCKDKGMDKGWGGEWMFMWVFFLVFMMWGRGGFGNMNAQDQASAQTLAHAAGINLQDIIAVTDRITQAQAQNMQSFSNLSSQVSGATNDIVANTTSGFRDVQSALCQGFNGISTGLMTSFNSLDTKICQSIAEVISSVRNQGDRVYDATRTVGDAVRDCCCNLSNKIDAVTCKVDGLYGHTSLVGERLANAMDKQFCATDQKIDKLAGEVALGQERLACLITSTAKEQEAQRLQRRVAELEANQNNAMLAQGMFAQFKDWASCNLAGVKAGGSAPTA